MLDERCKSTEHNLQSAPPDCLHYTSIDPSTAESRNDVMPCTP